MLISLTNEILVHISQRDQTPEGQGRKKLPLHVAVLFPLGSYQEVVEGGQTFLRAQEEARLAVNPMCGVRGSFSGAEFEIFSFAGP